MLKYLSLKVASRIKVTSPYTNNKQDLSVLNVQINYSQKMNLYFSAWLHVNLIDELRCSISNPLS